MKKLLFFAAYIISLGSCIKETPPANNCEDVACTMMFAAVTVQVKDNSAQPVTLDEYYTVNISRGDTIRPINGTWGDGSYVVVDDNYVSKMYNQEYNFRFIGFVKGKPVVNEVYSISADCCHVNKKSGTGEIVIN